MTFSVLRLLLSEVGRFLLAGGVLGLPVAYLLARAVESILFGVRAADVSVFSAGVALMAAVSLAAALPPTLRAARIHVTDALRSE